MSKREVVFKVLGLTFTGIGLIFTGIELFKGKKVVLTEQDKSDISKQVAEEIKQKKKAQKAPTVEATV